MKIAGTVQVEVPEPYGLCCPSGCPLKEGKCPHAMVIEGPTTIDRTNLAPFEGWFFEVIPGPPCPAFDSVPNTWPDEFPDRPWDDEAEDELIEVRMKRLISADK